MLRPCGRPLSQSIRSLACQTRGMTMWVRPCAALSRAAAVSLAPQTRPHYGCAYAREATVQVRTEGQCDYPGAGAAGREGRLEGRVAGGTIGSCEICLRIRCPSGERTTRSRLGTLRSPARMHRSTWNVIGASLMRQDHSEPLVPDQTRKASPLRSSRIRHLRMDVVHVRLAFVGTRTAPLPIGCCQPLAPQTGPL